jgi:NAD(P)H-hydrate epimerase
MTPLVLTRRESRQVDKRAVEQWGISSLVLMENAGRGAADGLCQLESSDRHASILCGKGNNGGDGLVMARHLHLRGWNVQAILFHDPDTLSPDTRANFLIAQQCGISLHHLANNESPQLETLLDAASQQSRWLVDSLLGTGSTGAPRNPLDKVIGWMNRASVRRIALDVPTGLDCDTAEVAGIAVQADYTFTFATAKPGLLSDSAAAHIGQLEVLDIGLPRQLLQECAADGPAEA